MVLQSSIHGKNNIVYCSWLSPGRPKQRD